MGIIHDHERIELGQSTDKQPVLVLVRGDNCSVNVSSVATTALELDNQAIDITDKKV
jgi:hypothetical protein